jgi:transcriptional regulator with XRE-family HTH domain
VTSKLPEFKTVEQLAAEDAQHPAMAAELARTAVANQLAILVSQYCVDHGLTQTALARLLGVKQPAVARLEAGDYEPTVATLARLSRALHINLRLDVAPSPWCSFPRESRRVIPARILDRGIGHLVAGPRARRVRAWGAFSAGRFSARS